MVERLAADFPARKKPSSDDGTDILDEIRCNIAECEKQARKDPRLCLGDLAYECIHDCVRRQYAKHAGNLPTTLRSVDDCANQFIIEKFGSIVEKTKVIVKSDAPESGRKKGFTNDDDFRRYVSHAVKMWFNGLHAKDTEKLQDALRKRLTRLAEAGRGPVYVPGKGRSGRWGLVGASSDPSPVDMVALKAAAKEYPLTIDYAKNVDASRSRSVNLGERGQLDKLLIGILEQAQGTLSLGEITRIVLYKVPQLGKPEIDSMDAPVGGDDGPSLVLRIADSSNRDPAELLFDTTSRTDERIRDAVLSFYESATETERKAADKTVAEIADGKTPIDLVRDPKLILECLLGTSETFPLASSFVSPALMNYLISSNDSNE